MIFLAFGINILVIIIAVIGKIIDHFFDTGVGFVVMVLIAIAITTYPFFSTPMCCAMLLWILD